MSCTEKIPEMFQEGVEAAAKAIRELNQVILAAHVNLDGDAFGSLLAMARILNSLGKKCFIYSSTGIPDYLGFLSVPCPICEDLNYPPFPPEGAVYLDCCEPSRLGPALAARCGEWPSINIDHHLGGSGMGSLANCVYPQAAATAQLAAYAAMALKIPVSGGLGEAVGTGLITDTGGFCHGNTTADVFELCALLMEKGLNMHRLRESLYNNWTINKLRLWGRLFLNAELLADGGIALCVISREELDKCHCRAEDAEGLAERLRNIKYVKLSAVLREEKDGVCRFSLRSAGSVDARAIAVQAGGGGHKNAAGGTLAMPLSEASRELRRLLEKGIRPYKNI